VAARAGNGLGGAGVCPRCSIMPVKVVGADGTATEADVAPGITWAADHGANVINLSFGGTYSSTIADAIAYATRKGVLVVAAAGNNGNASAFYPAADPGVLGVAATQPDDQLYSWSNYAPGSGRGSGLRPDDYSQCGVRRGVRDLREHAGRVGPRGPGDVVLADLVSSGCYPGDHLEALTRCKASAPAGRRGGHRRARRDLPSGPAPRPPVQRLRHRPRTHLDDGTADGGYKLSACVHGRSRSGSRSACDPAPPAHVAPRLEGQAVGAAHALDTLAAKALRSRPGATKRPRPRRRRSHRSHAPVLSRSVRAAGSKADRDAAGRHDQHDGNLQVEGRSRHGPHPLSPHLAAPPRGR
jgi:subtilisin family serine protease